MNAVASMLRHPARPWPPSACSTTLCMARMGSASNSPVPGDRGGQTALPRCRLFAPPREHGSSCWGSYRGWASTPSPLAAAIGVAGLLGLLARGRPLPEPAVWGPTRGR